MNKKSSFLVLVLLSACSLYISAQDKIKTEIDSLSYSYGFFLAGQGLDQYMGQLGIAKTDTEKMDSFIKGLSDGLTQKIGERTYITGVTVAGQVFGMSDNLKSQTGIENLNMQLVADGLRDALTDKASVVSEPGTFFNSKLEEFSTRQSAGVIEESKRFLEENKVKEGVVTLPSGLQYKILTKGDGEIPQESNKVKVHYRGTLTDGTQFDSSYDRGEPIVLGVTQVIKGWTEALQLMPVGSKWELYVPYDLGYGDRATPQIPAYSTLIFEVELLGIE